MVAVGADRTETVTQYALRTGLSEQTVYKRIKRGELEAEKVLSPGPGKRCWYWLIRTEFFPRIRGIGKKSKAHLRIVN